LAYQGVDSGAAGAYIITTSGGQCGSYTDGLTIEAKLLNGNTTSCTIAVDSGATVGLTQPNGQSLASGALVANNWYRMMYNSTYSAWTVISPTPATTITSNTISAAAPTNKVGLVAAGGVSTACVPIDATYALDQTIAPTMTGAWTFNNTVTFGSTVSFTTGLTLTAVANAYALILNTLSTVGQSKGLQINAGTNASDICAQFNNQSGTLNLNILGEGSVVVGAATGGGQGRGSINAQALYVNGVAVLTSSASGANPTAKVGTSVVNGSATTFMRSDGAPPIDLTITPTWTGAHTFNFAAGAATAVTIDAAVNNHGLQITGATNTSGGAWVARMFSAQGSGFSNGLWLIGGTTSGDVAFLVDTATAGNATLFEILGNGETYVIEPVASTGVSGCHQVGYVDIPQHSVGASDVTVAFSDRGKHLLMNNTGHKVIVSANATTALPIGHCTTIICASGVTSTATVQTDTLTWLPSGNTGARVIAPFGMATLLKIGATSWVISGVGIT
jgi:hypothetical protein